MALIDSDGTVVTLVRTPAAPAPAAPQSAPATPEPYIFEPVSLSPEAEGLAEPASAPPAPPEATEFSFEQWGELITQGLDGYNAVGQLRKLPELPPWVSKLETGLAGLDAAVTTVDLTKSSLALAQGDVSAAPHVVVNGLDLASTLLPALKLAPKLNLPLTGAAITAEGSLQTVESALDGNLEGTAVGAIKTAAGVTVLTGLATANPVLVGTGLGVYGGAVVYENREPLVDAAQVALESGDQAWPLAATPLAAPLLSLSYYDDVFSRLQPAWRQGANWSGGAWKAAGQAVSTFVSSPGKLFGR